MRMALEQHNVVLRAVLRQWRGYEVKTQGDSFGIGTVAGRFGVGFGHLWLWLGCD